MTITSHPVSSSSTSAAAAAAVDRANSDFSFFEALSLAPARTVSLDSDETISTPRTHAITTNSAVPVTVRNGGNSSTVALPESKRGVAPSHQSQHHQHHQHSQKTQKNTSPQPTGVKSVSKKMASSSAVRAQKLCLETCNKATKLGDRIAVRMLEYLASGKTQDEKNVDTLAHGFLDTCQVLLTIQAGLEDCNRAQRVFPGDLITELDKKFRVMQSDFQLLDQMLSKLLDYLNKGAMGRMRRGWGKMFGDHDIEKMTFTLSRTRESLRLSALMFRWSLGGDKVDSSAGIGYTALAAALDRLDQQSGHASQSTVSLPKAQPSVRVDSLSTRTTQSVPQYGVLHQPLPPLPLSPSTISNDPTFQAYSLSSGGGGGGGDIAGNRKLPQYFSSAGTSSTASSNERAQSIHTAATLERLSSFDDTVSVCGTTTTEHDGLLEEIAGIELGPSKIVRLTPDTESMPHWAPRSKSTMDDVSGSNSLIAAIRGKNHKMVEQLLDRGVSPNTTGIADCNALTEAVSQQDTDMVRLLLAFGAGVDDADRNGVTPLMAAVEKSFLDGAVMLLRYGADPNMATTISGGVDTILTLAAKSGKVSMTHLLLVYGGDAKLVTAEGNTLAMISISKKAPRKLLDLILEYGADPDAKNREGKTAMFDVIQLGRADLLASLLDHGANPNLPGPKHMLWPSTYQPQCLRLILSRGADHKKAPGIMELAASLNNIESVRLLLEANVDPNAKKDGVYTPLCTSIRDNRPEIFNLLLTHGADPNVKASEYPAWKCITHNRLHFLPPLVEAGASLTSPKGILEQAVASNNVEALAWLLDQDINPNERNAQGHSALTTAIRENRSDMVDVLLARGADPNMRGEDWPICMAVRNPPILKRILSVLAEPRAFKGVMEMAVTASQLESVKLLIAAGVSVEDRNGGVFSPLTTAIRENNKEIVTYLIESCGADVNAPGEHLPIVKAVRRYHGDDTIMRQLLGHGADPNKMYRGWNAVMQAVENGDAEVLKLLVDKAGVDLSVKDELGRNVTDMASSRGWDEAVKILKGAKTRI
jgi:ankyrin repeat protein